MKNNWVIGHWSRRSGVFHQNIWVNGNTGRITDDSYLLSIETPKKITMRSSKHNSKWINVETNDNINIPNETGISINNGRFSGEASDFNFAYLAIYDRILNSAEKEKIKKDLVKRFVITKSIKSNKITTTGPMIWVKGQALHNNTPSRHNDKWEWTYMETDWSGKYRGKNFLETFKYPNKSLLWIINHIATNKLHNNKNYKYFSLPSKFDANTKPNEIRTKIRFYFANPKNIPDGQEPPTNNKSPNTNIWKSYKLNKCKTDGTWYYPLNMPGQGRTLGTPEQCRQRCINTPGCKYFNNFPNSGCHISTGKGGSRINRGNPTRMSGSITCNINESFKNTENFTNTSSIGMYTISGQYIKF